MSVLTVSFLAAQIAAGAPFHTSYAPEQTPTGPAAVVEAMLAPGDVFAAEALLSEAELRGAAGGFADTTFVFENNALTNNSSMNGSQENLNAAGAVTGGVAGTSVDNNSGITTVLNNTGNNVLFQSSVQVNVFLDGVRAGE